MKKKILTAVIVVAVIGYFAFMTTHSTMSFTAVLDDNNQWTSATYEFVSGEEAELEITFKDNGNVKIKGPNDEMTVLITFKDDKQNTKVYEYIIEYDLNTESNQATLEPYGEE